MFNLGNSLFDQNKFAEAAKYYASVSAQSKEYWAAQRNLELANEALSNQNT
jgi:TolA-binding protein